MPPEALRDFLFGLLGKVYVNIYAFARVHKQGNPARLHMGPESVGRDDQVGDINPVHLDIVHVRQVNILRCRKLCARNVLHRRFTVVCGIVHNHFALADRQRHIKAGFAVQHLIQCLNSELVLIVMRHDLIAALRQIRPCRRRDAVKVSDGISLNVLCPHIRLILENNKKPAGNRLFGADVIQQVHVILLEYAAGII
jgi:hypothetical protein